MIKKGFYYETVKMQNKLHEGKYTGRPLCMHYRMYKHRLY